MGSLPVSTSSLLRLAHPICTELLKAAAIWSAFASILKLTYKSVTIVALSGGKAFEVR